MQNSNAQNVTEPDFRKKSFPAENTENMPEKPVFWHFLEISSLVFSNFLHKDAYKQYPKYGVFELDFWETFFLAENARNIPEIAAFADFHLTFSLLYLCFFTQKRYYNNSHDKTSCICLYNSDFCTRNFLKIAGTADFCWKICISWFSWAVVDIFSWNFAHLM